MSRENRVVAALRGPLMLVTLGLLLLADLRAGWRLQDTWPVLLIVYGLLRLLAQLLAPAAEQSSGRS